MAPRALFDWSKFAFGINGEQLENVAVERNAMRDYCVVLARI